MKKKQLENEINTLQKNIDENEIDKENHNRTQLENTELKNEISILKIKLLEMEKKTNQIHEDEKKTIRK